MGDASPTTPIVSSTESGCGAGAAAAAPGEAGPRGDASLRDEERAEAAEEGGVMSSANASPGAEAAAVGFLVLLPGE
jgi:hypothetical protein